MCRVGPRRRSGGSTQRVWDKPGPLSSDELERARLHPCLTERILSRCPELALGALASSHHERMDGSGYHPQSTIAQLPIDARLLASSGVRNQTHSCRILGDPDDHFAGSDPIVGEIFGQHLYGVQAILLWWRGRSSIKLPRMVWRNLPS